MATYSGDRKLESVEQKLSISINWDNPLSFTDYGQLLQDIDTLYRISAREMSSRLRGSNVKRREAALIAREFRGGSLDILADPYFQGTVGSLAATAITSVFVYVLRRIKGKPENKNEDPIVDFDSNNQITDDRYQEAANTAVARTAPARKRIENSMRTFGISITIRFENRNYDIR